MADDDTPLTHERLRELAALARLALRDDELDALRADLAAILGYVAVLDELELEGVEPMGHALLAETALREDRVDPDDVLARERFLALAPQHEGPYLLVPRVLGDEGGS